MQKTETYNQGKADVFKDQEHDLVLHNDEVNSFDYVIESLIEVCGHERVQAEQCTMIAHFKGKCSVLSGSSAYLNPFQTEMSRRGLSVTIE